jgi:hypothetical protein
MKVKDSYGGCFMLISLQVIEAPAALRDQHGSAKEANA